MGIKVGTVTPKNAANLAHTVLDFRTLKPGAMVSLKQRCTSRVRETNNGKAQVYAKSS